MAALEAVAGSEDLTSLGSGKVLYIARAAVAADADTLTCPTGTIISVMGTFRDSAITAAAVLSVTWATNVITFQDIAEASTVEVWVIARQA